MRAFNWAGCRVPPHNKGMREKKALALTAPSVTVYSLMYLMVGDSKLLSFSTCQVLAVVGRDCGTGYPPRMKKSFMGVR